jgi:hypothetical protein
MQPLNVVWFMDHAVIMMEKSFLIPHVLLIISAVRDTLRTIGMLPHLVIITPIQHIVEGEMTITLSQVRTPILH